MVLIIPMNYYTNSYREIEMISKYFLSDKLLFLIDYRDIVNAVTNWVL